MSFNRVVRARRAGLAIEALTDEIQGEVILPFHRDYDCARRVFNGAIDRTPHAIIRPRDVNDVIAAVAYARNNDLAIAVRAVLEEIATAESSGRTTGHQMSEYRIQSSETTTGSQWWLPVGSSESCILYSDI